MSNTFAGDGNLGAAPVLRTVNAGGEKKQVADFSIRFDNYRSDGNGGYEESGGFWLKASIWGKRAEAAVKLLQKGARVHVTGRLVEEAWQDKDGEARTAIRLNLDDIYLSTMRIDTVTFKARSEGARVVEQEGVPA